MNNNILTLNIKFFRKKSTFLNNMILVAVLAFVYLCDYAVRKLMPYLYLNDNVI